MLSMRECKKGRYVIIPRTQICILLEGMQDGGLTWGSRELQRDSGHAPLRENLGLCSFFLASATLATSSFSEGCMAAVHCILEYKDRLLSHSKAEKNDSSLLLARGTDS